MAQICIVQCTLDLKIDFLPGERIEDLGAVAGLQGLEAPAHHVQLTVQSSHTALHSNGRGKFHKYFPSFQTIYQPYQGHDQSRMILFIRIYLL
jgi:hypothetical protein